MIKELRAQRSEHLPHVQAITTSVGLSAGLAMPQRVHKRWGWEDIYINDIMYCMKRLYIKAGCQTSMHFHVIKHETLLVSSGTLTLSYKDGRGCNHTVLLPEGEAFVVPPGLQHQLIATDTDVMLIEASSTDHKEDSIRVHM